MNTDLSKRNFLKAGGVAAVGALTLGAKGCGPSMSVWVQTMIGTFEELKPLLPNQAQLLSKAVSVARSFNDAWQDKKFADAGAVLENLTTTIGEIISAAGINLSDSVKTMLSVVGVALRTIGVLMKEQTSDPQVAAAVSERVVTSSAVSRQKSLIEKLADPAVVDAVFVAARP